MVNNYDPRRSISTHSLTKRLTAIYFLDEIGENISTHSLTKRLTWHLGSMGGSPDISTHSLTKRLTGLIQDDDKMQKHFNSQPHEEADL